MSERQSIRVKVEPCDIRDAQPCAVASPIARAIRRRLRKPPAVLVAVWVGRVRVGATCYWLPPEVDAADTHYTKTGQMTPFDFPLSNEPVPCHVACQHDSDNQKPPTPKNRTTP